MNHILVVDDSDVERRLAAGLLVRNKRFRLCFAENGRDALGALARAQAADDLPNLVLTDLVMPELDGLELVKAVRAEYPHIPVVLMTAYGNEWIANHALRCGAASYVPKAQQSERLLPTVEQVLARGQIEQARQRLMECVQDVECSFLLDSDPALIRPLVDFVQQALCGVPLTDAAGRIRLAIALEEALLNAVCHGALKVNKNKLAEMRAGLPDDKLPDVVTAIALELWPSSRKIFVQIKITAFEARFVIRDRGAGFDQAIFPNGDGADRFEHGRNRGLTLIRSLADEVRYNEVGNEVTLLKRRDLRAVSARARS